MPRNIVICCDGTNNEFGTRNTNVVRLVQVLIQDDETQTVYYDPGVGTMPEPGFVTRTGKLFSKVRALAFGTDVDDKVQRAYCHLMETWRPGDQTYLFGFSRGAYTVRLLGGMLHALGLLPRGTQNLVPYALRLFGATRRDQSYDKLIHEFRSTFARDSGDPERRMPMRFMGVWDTVSSVGWVWNPKTYWYTARNPSITIVRHAVSIDERRAFFRQNVFGAIDSQNLEEQWFAGVHSDVGGGYPPNEGGLWRAPFQWIVAAAQSAGLMVDPARLADVLGPDPIADSIADDAHESLTWKWWLAEFVPKMTYSGTRKRRIPVIGQFRGRRIPCGIRLHESAARRIIQRADYNPRGLERSFLDQLRRQSDINGPVIYNHPDCP